MNNNFLIKYHLPPILWGLIIFVISSIPSDAIPNIQIFGIDKVVHFFVFFIFGVLVYRSLYFSGNKIRSVKTIAFYTILIIAVFGGLDEIYQSLIPGRSTDIFDFIADLVGGISSTLVSRRYFVIRSKETLT